MSYTITEQKLIKLLGETNILIQSIDRTKINTIHPTYILQKRPLFETLYEDFLLEVRSAEAEEEGRDDERESEKDGEKDDEKNGEKDGEKDVENNPTSTKDEFTKQSENSENNFNSDESVENSKPDSSGHLKALHIFAGDEPILQNLAEKSPALKADFQRLFSIIRYYQKENIPTAKEWIEVLFDGDEDERDSIRSRGKNGSSIVKRLRRKFSKLFGIGGVGGINY